jgi:hypothetical protein
VQASRNDLGAPADLSPQADASPLPDLAPSCAGGQAQVVDPTSGHCYMLFSAAAWNAANNACLALGPKTHLVTITTPQEDALVHKLVGDNQRAWIGLGANTGVWAWVTGEPLQYQNWDLLEPNGSGPCADTVAGFWRDWDCGVAEAYVCERDAP